MWKEHHIQHPLLLSTRCPKVIFQSYTPKPLLSSLLKSLALAFNAYTLQRTSPFLFSCLPSPRCIAHLFVVFPSFSSECMALLMNAVLLAMLDSLLHGFATTCNRSILPTTLSSGAHEVRYLVDRVSYNVPSLRC